MALSALLHVMAEASFKAGRSLNRKFGDMEALQVSRKRPGDYVSNADKQAEKILFEELQKARPSYGFLMEEGGVVEGTDGQHRWIIDPLDGTTNFLHAIPIFAISIALERAGELVAAVVYNPIMDELYTAEKGKGAFLNDKRLRVSGRQHIADAVFTTGIPYSGNYDDGAHLKNVQYISSISAGVRRFGAASLDLAWTAAGRVDGYWEAGLNPWDVAAGILLVKEAGGFITNYEGDDKAAISGESIIAGNAEMHKSLLKALKRS